MSSTDKTIYGIGVSNPEFTEPGLRHMTIHSSSLRGRGQVAVYIPQGCEGESDLSYITLLHGACGGALDWFVHGGAHRTLQRMIEAGEVPPMAVVCPSDGMRGISTGYLNTPDARFEDWIVRDVQEAVQTSFDCLTENSPRFIAGLSMGGYGALRIGAKFPEMWRAISAHSACPDLKRYFEIEPDQLMPRSFLDDPQTQPLHFLRKNRESLPPFRFDCGTEDHLIEQNRAFHSALESEGIAHDYEEYTGAHTWDYWSDKIKRSYRFFAPHLDE